MTQQDEHTDFRKYFQANLLDGDDVYHCGKAMLLAEDVYEVLGEHIAEQYISKASVREAIQKSRLVMLKKSEILDILGLSEEVK